MMDNFAQELTPFDQIKLNRLRHSEITLATSERPIVFLTISNGAGHTRAAQSISAAVGRQDAEAATAVLDVAQYMSPVGRFTHVSAYLWLVKNAPAVWRRIDEYQKSQPHTSPEWFYRRECRRLIEAIKLMKPGAIVATEVGCCEIGALIKRDLDLDIPLVAVNIDYEVDRAWVQPEVDIYTVCRPSMAEFLRSLGTDEHLIKHWGVPVQDGFVAPENKLRDRARVNDWLKLEHRLPLVILAGGYEGMGKIKETVNTFVERNVEAWIIVLTGRNTRLKRECELIARNAQNVRVLGWTNEMPLLFRAADVLVSKLGVTFDEACACGLPVVSMPPPPGSEELQYELMQRREIGEGVATPLQAAVAVETLLRDVERRSEMSKNALSNHIPGASENIASWLAQNIKR